MVDFFMDFVAASRHYRRRCWAHRVLPGASRRIVIGGSSVVVGVFLVEYKDVAAVLDFDHRADLLPPGRWAGRKSKKG